MAIGLAIKAAEVLVDAAETAAELLTEAAEAAVMDLTQTEAFQAQFQEVLKEVPAEVQDRLHPRSLQVRDMMAALVPEELSTVMDAEETEAVEEELSDDTRPDPWRLPRINGSFSSLGSGLAALRARALREAATQKLIEAEETFDLIDALDKQAEAWDLEDAASDADHVKTAFDTIRPVEYGVKDVHHHQSTNH